MIRDLRNRAIRLARVIELMFRPERYIELVATEDGEIHIKRQRTLREVVNEQEITHFNNNLSLRVDTPEWTALVDQLSSEIDDKPSFSEEAQVANLISTSLRIADDFIASPIQTDFNGTDIEISIDTYDVSSTLQERVGQPLFGTVANKHKQGAVYAMRQIASAS